ncbi:hypothetical protein U4Z48_18120, partial [Escherichia coli]|nr:hypothetical protein [Escherichia coli]
DLLQTFRAFPKEDKEKMLKEMKEKKILRWCEATGWIVTPHEIDGSTYPNPTDGLPVEYQANTQPEAGVIHENQA